MNEPFAPWQQRVYEQAVASLQTGRLGHALLLCGPPGLGKRAVAERLAHYVLCSEREADQPCGRCRSCLLYASRSQRDPLEQRPDKSLSHPLGHPAHPDAVFVGFAWRMTPSPPRQLTQIVVDNVRVLSERFSRTPQYGDALIAIIEPADALNDHACNALLKTLEEPVPGRYLWLVTAHPASLPATIRSRCQRLEFRLPPEHESLAWLQACGHAAGPAAEALEAARGHPGLAREWLEHEGMALRRAVADDLDRLDAGKAGPVETAQRWAADDQAAQRLAHAADLALARASGGGLTDPARLHKLATWFDAANQARDLLHTTVRSDLLLADLLLAWRVGVHPRAGTGDAG